MGFFQHKQKPQGRPPIDESSDGIQRFFDGYFADLRSRGREQFEKSVEENETAFKQELDSVVAQANAELKSHIAKQLDEQIAENSRVMKEAQNEIFASLSRSAQGLQEQHKQLTDALQKTVANQETVLNGAFEENKAQIAAMKQAQDTALQSLNNSVQALQQQQQQLGLALQQNIANQEAMLVNAFEQNMARIVEHYLLGALGDQYDLKAQLPSIIKQMEANKEAMVDDMKL